MRAARYLTLLWPGLPWLWLRGSLPGLVVAVGFALTLDVAVLTTWIWSDLIELPARLAVWVATAVIWALATASAVSAFPPPLAIGRDAESDTLYVKARNAYLAHDWLTAEATLRTLLRRDSTDGEAQLLLGTLLRRVGRFDEARAALDQLSRADSGRLWQSAIVRELARIDADSRAATDTAGPTILSVQPQADDAGHHTAAA
ncbi:MAG: tetratricopeptide repeat protein [Pirellulales bacterium]